ncbi:MAG: type VI secretion system protein TssA, partial [Methylomicrobium sp.]|nr:type VI secretion system protein TssA [Methylomicrobium sp.]
IEAAVQNSDTELLQQNMASVEVSLQSLNELENFVTQQVGINNAPNFSELRDLLKEFLKLISEWLAARGEGGVTESISEQEFNGDDKTERQTTQKSISGAINNNQDVIKTLKLICDYYKKNEPSSPVPILLERASRLVGKDFMELLRDIAPEGISQAEMIKGLTDEDE